MLERFISPDPLLCGLTNTLPLESIKRNPQTLNAFAYVSNSPINLRDPLGLSPECQYYDGRCADILTGSLGNFVGYLYYCGAAKFVCEKAPRDPFTDCYRSCLQGVDSGCNKLFGKKNSWAVSCSPGAHVICVPICVDRK